MLQRVRTNARGVAAADYDNDGRVDLAVNTIGGRLLLLHNTTPSGNWLTVDVRPFSPGAVVTARFGDHGARVVREVQAGSSYLSSEDPRVHFGFGNFKPTELIVRWPDGTSKRFAPATNTIFIAKK